MRSITAARLAACQNVSKPPLLVAPALGSDFASIHLRLDAIEACIDELLALGKKVAEGGVALRVVDPL